MNIITEINKELINTFEKAGYKVDSIELKPSARKDLGDYQINDCMSLASTYHTNPREIAENVVKELEKNSIFTDINIAGPGFINLKLSEEFLIDNINKAVNNPKDLIEKQESKKIIIDYGGANVAKALHVGHLRSANIGEALKRLAKSVGYEVIGDAHLGDYGRPLGFVVKELKERYPDLPYFDENYDGDYSEVELPISNEDLEEIYPYASQRAKDDEDYLEDGRDITNKIQHHERGYYDLWKKIVEISKADIREVYNDINVDFELWNGESDAIEYQDKLDEIIAEKNILVESEGAKVIEVKEENDKIEIPPLLYIKSNGTISYETTDLLTLLQRKEEINPDEIWYVVDSRQGLHFEQVFRATEKLGLFDKEQMEHIGFGTMNGKDGKPFKTRDGGVMTLKGLINLVYNSTITRINNDKVTEEEAPEIAKTVAIAALKYADLVPYRETDYIFEVEKFTDIEGRTGPYILYTTIRMKSLLNNATDMDKSKITKIEADYKDLVQLILDLPNIINKALKTRSLNEIADYLYNICSLYNTFYAKNKVLTEENIERRTNWLTLTKLTYDICSILLDILAIKVPEKM